MSGLDRVHLLRQACPIAGIVLESASVAPDAIHEARVRGADDFLPKSVADAQVVTACLVTHTLVVSGAYATLRSIAPVEDPAATSSTQIDRLQGFDGAQRGSLGYVVLYGGTPDSVIYAVGIIITDFRLRHEETAKEVLQALRAYLAVHVPAIILVGDTSPQRLRDAQSTAALPLHKPASTHQLHGAMVQLIAHPPASAQDERARQSDAAITTSAATIP